MSPKRSSCKLWQIVSDIYLRFANQVVRLSILEYLGKTRRRYSVAFFGLMFLMKCSVRRVGLYPGQRCLLVYAGSNFWIKATTLLLRRKQLPGPLSTYLVCAFRGSIKSMITALFFLRCCCRVAFRLLLLADFARLTSMALRFHFFRLMINFEISFMQCVLIACQESPC